MPKFRRTSARAKSTLKSAAARPKGPEQSRFKMDDVTRILSRFRLSSYCYSFV